MNGEWTQWRGDKQRTGRASVAGRIGRPWVDWRHFVGCREDWISIGPGNGGRLELPAGEVEVDLEAVSRQYGLARYLDVDGSGKTVKIAESPGCRFHRLLPDTPGYQRVQFTSAFQIGIQDNYGWLESFEEGLEKPRRRWESVRDHTYFMPLILFADVDGDGREELVVSVHYRIIVFDPETGEKKQELKYCDFRNYGDFHAVDLDGDRLPEFVQIVTFQAHLEVIDNEGGQLKLGWFRDINAGVISRLNCVTMPPHRPFGDVDGDGRMEVVCTFFDLEGDGRWHVMAFEARSGERVLDLPDTVLLSLEDVDGDGVDELLCADAPAPHWPEARGARLLSARGGQARSWWENPGAGWLSWRPPVDPPTSAYGSARGAWRVLGADVDGDGRQEVFTFEEEGAITRAWRLGKDGAEEVLHLAGVAPEVLQCQGGELLLRARRPEGQEAAVMTRGCRAAVVASRRLGGRPQVPLVLGAPAGPLVVLPTAADEVVALRAGAGAAQMQWRVPGHGMDTGDPGQGLASVQAGGGHWVIAAASGPGRSARIQAVDLEGRVRWQRDFPAFRHRPFVWNCNGMVNWSAGRFLGRAGEDVVVVLRRNTMHSDEGYLLRGDTGEVVWRRDGSVTVGAETRGFGGMLFAVVSQGEREDLVSGYPDIYYVAEGPTGQLKAERILAYGAFPIQPEPRHQEWWCAYFTPIVADLDADGQPEVILGGGNYLTALLRLDGTPVWHTGYISGKPPRPMQGIGEVDGDGRLEVGSWEPERGFVCLDGATGQVRWEWSELEISAASIAVCDVDGDGVEEFLAPTEKELIAFNGKGGEANVVWRFELPAPCREVVAADVDGDGLAEILAPCSDGYLYCVRGEG